MDAHYGQQPWLLSALEEEGLEYVADLPCDTRVYLDCPQVGVPPRKGKRGRTPSVPRVLEGSPIQVRTLLDSEQLEWHVVKVRDTQRGALWIQFAALRVYRIEEELPVERPVWLLIRRELATGEEKFSFSTLPEETSIEGLAHRQSTRYWVERALEDAKGLAGLDKYQGLGWRGWHHHYEYGTSGSAVPGGSQEAARGEGASAYLAGCQGYPGSSDAQKTAFSRGCCQDHPQETFESPPVQKK